MVALSTVRLPKTAKIIWPHWLSLAAVQNVNKRKGFHFRKAKQKPFNTVLEIVERKIKHKNTFYLQTNSVRHVTMRRDLYGVTTQMLAVR